MPPSITRCTLPMLLAIGLAGCGLAPLQPPAAARVSAAPADPAALVAPPAALLLQGVPPVPQRLADAVAPYTDFAGHQFVDWHPQRREMLVSHRSPNSRTTQLYRLRGPLAELEPLTDGSEPVSRGWFDPRGGEAIVFARGQGGDEAYQLYRLDPPSRDPVLLTDPDQRHSLESWLHRSSRAIIGSLPLDRTAAGGRRSQIDARLWLLDPARPGDRRTIAELPGAGWGVRAVSPDDRHAALERFISANESEVWLLDLASGERRKLLPAPGAPAASYRPGDFSADGRSLYLVTDRSGEFLQAQRLDLASGALTPVGPVQSWDVQEVEASADGALLALRLNVDGRNELRLVDAATLRERAALAMPPGNLGSLRFHPQRSELAFSVANAQGPGQIHTLDPADGRVQPWTRARLHPTLDTASLTEQQIVRWTSFDGRLISGLLNRPPPSFGGRRPVLINIHGGPESQARVGFAGRNNYLLQVLGIAVLQPNVRGSDGYGKTFLAADNGLQREDPVKDIGTLLDWIATQPDLDPDRVVVAGGSYGGFMSLAVATTYPERIAGTIDVVGISNLVSFLENTESYRRDLRRAEYGDERDPVMRAFQTRISPLFNAHRIRRPLMVVQGRNDPRVPYTEAEQIVARVRANGTPVSYLRAENEGHGFARKENADYQFYATVMFLQRTLLEHR